MFPVSSFLTLIFIPYAASCILPAGKQGGRCLTKSSIPVSESGEDSGVSGGYYKLASCVVH